MDFTGYRTLMKIYLRPIVKLSENQQKKYSILDILKENAPQDFTEYYQKTVFVRKKEIHFPIFPKKFFIQGSVKDFPEDNRRYRLKRWKGLEITSKMTFLKKFNKITIHHVKIREQPHRHSVHCNRNILIYGKYSTIYEIAYTKMSRWSCRRLRFWHLVDLMLHLSIDAEQIDLTHKTLLNLIP